LYKNLCLGQFNRVTDFRSVTKHLKQQNWELKKFFYPDPENSQRSLHQEPDVSRTEAEGLEGPRRHLHQGREKAGSPWKPEASGISP